MNKILEREQIDNKIIEFLKRIAKKISTYPKNHNYWEETKEQIIIENIGKINFDLELHFEYATKIYVGIYEPNEKENDNLFNMSNKKLIHSFSVLKGDESYFPYKVMASYIVTKKNIVRIRKYILEKLNLKLAKSKKEKKLISDFLNNDNNEIYFPNIRPLSYASIGEIVNKGYGHFLDDFELKTGDILVIKGRKIIKHFVVLDKFINKHDKKYEYLITENKKIEKGKILPYEKTKNLLNWELIDNAYIDLYPENRMLLGPRKKMKILQVIRNSKIIWDYKKDLKEKYKEFYKRELAELSNNEENYSYEEDLHL